MNKKKKTTKKKTQKKLVSWEVKFMKDFIKERAKALKDSFETCPECGQRM